MIEMGKKYQTRDGRAVRILCVDGPGEDYPVVGVIEGQKHTDSWTAKGLMSKCVAFPMDNLDLIPVPTKHEGWVFVDGDRVLNTGVYRHIKVANDAVQYVPQGFYLAHVTWED